MRVTREQIRRILKEEMYPGARTSTYDEPDPANWEQDFREAARQAIVSAMKPKLGRYKGKQSLMVQYEKVASRMRDIVDIERDNELSDHVNSQTASKD